MIRAPLVVVVLAAAVGAVPARAQQAATGRATLAGPLLLPSPADTGKPVIFEPPPLVADPMARPGCPAALPCGVRIIGTVQKNGAVELNATALRW